MDNRERARALLPCPFCGGRAVLYTQEVREHDALVECEGCCAEITAPNDAAAIAHWNQREARGSASIADEATVERVAQASYEERIRQKFGCKPGAAFHPRLGQRTLAWAELPESSKAQERNIARAALAVTDKSKANLTD